MTAVSSTRTLGPCAQVEQFYSAIGSLVEGLCESTDNRFEHVRVVKLFPEGTPGSAMRDINGEQRNCRVFMSVLDNKTGDLYMDDSCSDVALKCVLIFAGITFYAAGQLVYHVSFTVFKVSALTIDTLRKVCEQLSLQRLYEASNEVRKGVIEIGDALGDGLFEVVKVPICELGILFATCYGVFKPYHGRRCVAMIENAWQAGSSHKNGCQIESVDTFMGCARNFHPTSYLAQCFQVRANRDTDPRVVQIIRQERVAETTAPLPPAS